MANKLEEYENTEANDNDLVLMYEESSKEEESEEKPGEYVFKYKHMTEPKWSGIKSSSRPKPFSEGYNDTKKITQREGWL